MKTIGEDPNYSPTFLVYGDLGYNNGQSIPRIKEQVINGGNIDAILHVGDIAYDLYSVGSFASVCKINNIYSSSFLLFTLKDDGNQGDKFMETIEPVASRVPYMTIPGNHEWEK